MAYAPGSSFLSEFITANFNGAAADADALPTAVMAHNGVDDTNVAMSVTHIDTGRYRIFGTIPLSYAASDAIAVVATAVIGGVIVKQILHTGPLAPGWAPGQAFKAEFVTANNSGAAQNADALPVASMAHNAVDDGSVVMTVSNIDAGRYLVSGTIPSTYNAGDAISILVQAIISSFALKTVVFSGALAAPVQTSIVSVANLRVQISDVARPFPSSSDAPDTIGVGDGTRTIFFLRFPNYVPGSLVLLFGTIPTTLPNPPAYVAQSAASYAVSGTQISFLAAPPTGAIIGSQCNATYFADSDLQNYLNNAMAIQSEPRLILKQAQYDLLDVIIGDVEKWIMLRESDYQRDPKAAIEALTALKKALAIDITGAPTPGSNRPAYAVQVNSFRRYDIRR